MPHPQILQEIAIIAAVGAAVAVLLGRLRLPTVAGLLAAGALIGPHALGLVDDLASIEVIAEVGVVLLLFTIGLEFSLARLRHIFRTVALGGVLQVGGTIAVVAAMAGALGLSTEVAVLYGFVFALSSTAIVLRALAERGETDAPHGRFVVGALIFQDLCIVPMVLLVPLLAGDGEGAGWMPIAWALGKAAAVVVGVVVVARLVVPRLLAAVDASRSREVFLLAVVTLCVGTAWLTSLAGLSLALGAFLGGIVVADTEYSHRALSDMLPLRGVFVSIFFVSLGMLFDGGAVAEKPDLVALLLLLFVVGKGVLATLAALLMRFPPRAAWLAGVGLAQFGEFGFVLTRLRVRREIVTDEPVAPLLAAGIISMFLTPLLVHWAPHVTAGERLLAPLARLLNARSIDEDDTPETAPRDHVVVIGYGVGGRMVAARLAALGVRHVVLEANAENVRQGRADGVPVYYADATSAEALEHAHVQDARAVVLLINDPPAAARTVDAIRRSAPDVPVLVRTRYVGDTAPLLGVGATSVVAEELEASMQVLDGLLRRLEVEPGEAQRQLAAARASVKGGKPRA